MTENPPVEVTQAEFADYEAARSVRDYLRWDDHLPLVAEAFARHRLSAIAAFVADARNYEGYRREGVGEQGAVVSTGLVSELERLAERSASGLTNTYSDGHLGKWLRANLSHILAALAPAQPSEADELERLVERLLDADIWVREDGDGTQHIDGSPIEAAGAITRLQAKLTRRTPTAATPATDAARTLDDISCFGEPALATQSIPIPEPTAEQQEYLEKKFKQAMPSQDVDLSTVIGGPGASSTQPGEDEVETVARAMCQNAGCIANCPSVQCAEGCSASGEELLAEYGGLARAAIAALSPTLAQVRRDAREEAAKVAEREGGRWDYVRRDNPSEEWQPGSPFDRGKQEAAITIATAIRTLNEASPT